MHSPNGKPTGTAAAARQMLIRRSPFWGTIILGLRWTPFQGVKTMATDGTRLVVSHDWCEQIGVENTIGVLVHEASHIVQRHHLRMRDRPLRRWNRAADYAINPPIVRDGWRLPADLLFDKRFEYWTAERIDAFLADEEARSASADQSRGPQQSTPPGSAPHQPGTNDNTAPTTAAGSPQATGRDPSATGSSGLTSGASPPTPGQPAGPDPGHPAAHAEPAASWGEIRPAQDDQGAPLSPAAARTAEAALDQRVQRAAQLARKAGMFGASLEEIVDASLARPDWHNAFAREFAGVARYAQAWGRPNKRYIQSGFWLPGKQRAGTGNIAFVVDTSGSRTSRELSDDIGSAIGIVEETGPNRVILLQCDASVTAAEELGRYEIPGPITVKGRGGTRFQPAFDWIGENFPDVDAIVYATDLDPCDEPKDPGIPVIWLTTSNRHPPFGRAIRLDSH